MVTFPKYICISNLGGNGHIHLNPCDPSLARRMVVLGHYGIVLEHGAKGPHWH